VPYTVLPVLCDAAPRRGGVFEPRGVGGLLVAEYEPDAVVLEWYWSVVTVVSQWCYSDVTVTVVLQWCYKGGRIVTVMMFAFDGYGVRE
jgi:hypothetical protein